jgi:HD-GYP domain-containing protein (c-di-GMP phosphodiesterase class II)
VRLSEVISALSHALDLTEGQRLGHAARTCRLGLRLAGDAGLDADDRSALFYALLLKDAGCSSAAARMSALFDAGDDVELRRSIKLVDWTRPTEIVRYTASHVEGGSRLGRARRTVGVLRRAAAEAKELVEIRCERGADIVSMLGLPSAGAEAIRGLDEHWNGRGSPYGLKGDQIPLLARLACLAQTAEVFVTELGLDAARDMVRRRRGRWFDPELADRFLAIADDDPIWLRLRDDEVAADVAAIEPASLTLHADEARLDDIAGAFAQVIDAKSPFTARHSERVAEYAVEVGTRLGLGRQELVDLRRCGLLHDIGKLGVSNRILDKPGKLTDEEFAEIRRHPAYTEQVLSRVSAFAPLAGAAGAHHERLDGRGYHRGLGGDQIPPFAKILAVADVFDALSAERPYRGALPLEQVLEIMRRDVGSAFCPDAYAALLDYAGGEALPLAA